MRALFPRWSNSALPAVLILGAVGLLGVPIALMTWVRTPYSTDRLAPVEQPVQFDHRHHVIDDGIDCLYCHYTAGEAATASVPPTELCMNCHAQIWNESPLLEPVRRSMFTGRPIPWKRVHDLPDFVFFHHAVHVRKGVGCSSCHGQVETMPVVYAVESMSMGWCLDCHRRPEKHLRPPERVTDIAWRPPPDQEAQGRLLAERLQVAPPTHCTGCHR
ncbi:cytochrome c3 family protein [Vulgatibacter sp.]|uniref:cytochrome c3 family protein n=1 Tax=Vulgatibacter sp. TaxID=1971226 RepID=UPI0035647B3D